MQWRWLLVFLVACSGDSSSGGVDAAAGDSSGPDAPPVNPLDGVGQVELVQSGFLFLEGPQWREAEGYLAFTDIPASTVYRIAPGETIAQVLRQPSGNANGLAVDGSGSLIAAQHNTHSITRDGAEVVSTFESKRLNSPNDVVVAGDGTIYFTDPPYGLDGVMTQQNFNGVYRIAPNNQLTAEYRGNFDTTRPNGIGLSLDEKTLYVADTMDGKIWKYPIDANGALGERSELAMTAGNPDGLAVDMFGNIFVTTSAGVEVYSPAGTKWGTITVPMQPANCAFGGADHKTLYITARTALYEVQLANPGMPRK